MISQFTRWILIIICWPFAKTKLIICLIILKDIGLMCSKYIMAISRRSYLAMFMGSSCKGTTIMITHIIKMSIAWQQKMDLKAFWKSFKSIDKFGKRILPLWKINTTYPISLSLITSTLSNTLSMFKIPMGCSSSHLTAVFITGNLMNKFSK